ncbi:MAG: tRNA pseudouridine(13) synthase TruD, partial [Chloroflexi bacterium]|nr:tRNA pseudouridine(13) synthase TruD [Chloroflexota bacterium]
MLLPYITSDLPGTGGQIKVEPEHFVVEEVPLYEPGGEGDHLFVR